MIKFYVQNVHGNIRCTDGQWHPPTLISVGAKKPKEWKSKKGAERWIKLITVKPHMITIRQHD